MQKFWAFFVDGQKDKPEVLFECFLFRNAPEKLKPPSMQQDMQR
jgi:hypothetical protein